MVNFGLLTAEICWRVWGTPANFNGFHVLAALLHDTLVVGVTKLCGVEQRALPIFGRAAITLGIGPHSSCSIICRISPVSEALDPQTSYGSLPLEPMGDLHPHTPRRTPPPPSKILNPPLAIGMSTYLLQTYSTLASAAAVYVAGNRLHFYDFYIS